MGKTPLPNPHFEPWNPEVQRKFVSNAINFYKKQHGDPALTFNPPRQNWNWRTGQHYVPDIWGDRHQVRKDTLTYLYRLGHDLGYLKMAYKTFEWMILSGTGCHPVCLRQHRHWYGINCGRNDYEHWYPRDGVHFRQKVSGSRNVSMRKPNPKHEEDKRKRQEWREKKGFQRSRNQDGSWRRGLKSRGYFRKLGNRSMRRWEMACIAHEDWEAMADQEHQLKLWLNPRDWD